MLIKKKGGERIIFKGYNSIDYNLIESTNVDYSKLLYLFFCSICSQDVHDVIMSLFPDVCHKLGKSGNDVTVGDEISISAIKPLF